DRRDTLLRGTPDQAPKRGELRVVVVAHAVEPLAVIALPGRLNEHRVEILLEGVERLLAGDRNDLHPVAEGLCGELVRDDADPDRAERSAGDAGERSVPV